MARMLSLATFLSLMFLVEPAWACRWRCRVVTPVPHMPRADEVVLRLNLEKGRIFYQEMETVTTQNMKVMGQELKHEQRQTFVMEWTPLGKNEQGHWQLVQKIIGVKMDINIGGNIIKYDSEADSHQNPLSDFFRKLMKLELTFILDADHKILRIDGRERFVKELGRISPQMQPLLDKTVTEDALKSMAWPVFDQLPNKAVRVGESWTRSTKLDLGAIGSYRNELRYRYEGRSGDLDKISVQSNFTHQPPSSGHGLPFTITKTNLKSIKGEGEVYFDRAQGRVVSSTMNMTLQGDLTIEIGGKTTEVSMTQEQSTRTRTSSQNPLRKRN